MKNNRKQLNESSKKYLLELARKAIEAKFSGENIDVADNIDAGTVPDLLKEKSAVFVTLKKEGHLRGCIGTLEPVSELYRGVIDYARKAAFEDPRFPPLKKEELDSVRIEISKIDPPQRLLASDPEELIRTLEEKKQGVNLKAGSFRSTYLPQVWEELPDGRTFMSSLCMKAGLPQEYWKHNFDKIEISLYEVDNFGE